MPNDCEIYVDPEEDEVFFGSISERERNICTNLVKHSGSCPKIECKLNKVLDGMNVDEEKLEIRFNNEQSSKASSEVFINAITDSVLTLSEVEKEEETKKSFSNNVPLDSEHRTTSMKHKVDKNILTTPKSIVKADKDGGFLKILSEIALVKAEAEAYDNLEAVKEDENKENKIIHPIPEIKITEATPEKNTVLSPSKSINTELRRFRIIYNSPRSGDYQSKSFAENFENEKNYKNKCLDQDVEEVLSSDNKKSMDLIDFNDSESGMLNLSIILDEEETEIRSQNTEKELDEVTILEKQLYEVIPLCESTKSVINENAESDLKSQPPESFQKNINPPNNLRFSKEVRKIVEVLKKSSVDDTLNFTIPEIDLEGEENSFFSPEPVSVCEDTVIPNKNPENLQQKTSPKILTKNADNKLAMKSKTVEKEQRKLTPLVSKSKLQPIKYFSERRIYNKNEDNEKKKCAKKLTLEEKKPETAETFRGGRMGETNAISCSRIPVFSAKSLMIPATKQVVRPVTAKNTPAKTPSGKTYKNPKFNHIESPINAYIHKKPTSLVLNVKPEVKKDSLTKILKAQVVGEMQKVQDKTPNQQIPNNNVKLPFVEYKSATPYKIEKRPDSRLPRLTPNVMKLIGSHSPKVIKHEGRFYLNTPRKGSSTETTIVADPNEVSIVVSQPALKSNAIK